MKTNNELIQKYAELYGRGDKSSIEFMKRDTAAVIELNDGLLVAIEKPRIKKDFCFARDCNGISTEETEQNADEMAEYARTKTTYFYEKNMRPLLVNYKCFAPDEITQKDISFDWYLSKIKYKSPAVHDCHYMGCDRRMAWIDFFDDPKKICGGEEMPDGFRWLEPSEIEAIKEAYKKVIADFEKRLQNYLKKYGLTKLNVWTYYSD